MLEFLGRKGREGRAAEGTAALLAVRANAPGRSEESNPLKGRKEGKELSERITQSSEKTPKCQLEKKD